MRRLLVLAVLAAVPFAFPGQALACACCAENGQWYEASQQIGAFEVGELSRVAFARSASLYLGAAGFDDLKGISPVAIKYSVSVARTGRAWTFTFTDAKGNTGTLGFTLPRKATIFAADLYDGKQGGGGGPLIYKEWRLAGSVTATGIFMKGGSARLILQGRGNNCLAAEDFRSWRLEVKGPGADYAFFGKTR